MTLNTGSLYTTSKNSTTLFEITHPHISYEYYTRFNGLLLSVDNLYYVYDDFTQPYKIRSFDFLSDALEFFKKSTHRRFSPMVKVLLEDKLYYAYFNEIELVK